MTLRQLINVPLTSNTYWELTLVAERWIHKKHWKLKRSRTVWKKNTRFGLFPSIVGIMSNSGSSMG